MGDGRGEVDRFGVGKWVGRGKGLERLVTFLGSEKMCRRVTGR